MKYEVNLNTARAKKARLAAKIGHLGEKLLWVAAFGLAAAALLLWLAGGIGRATYLTLAVSALSVIFGLWYRFDLSKLPPQPKRDSLDAILEPLLLAALSKAAELTPRAAWQAAAVQWQSRFFTNHLQLDGVMVHQTLSSEAALMPAVWQKSIELMRSNRAQQIDSGILSAALVLNSKEAMGLLNRLKIKESDVLEVLSWQERLSSYFGRPNPYFGGIGRDWAAGFTPTLDKYGQNISRAVEHGQGHFHTLAHGDLLDVVVHNLSQGAGAVNLVGEAGSGKSSLVYALAERLLRGQDGSLLYYQIISLNASMILSSSKDLERAMLTLFGEAVHARNIIIFLDDARLFFSTGTGAFDISQILLPVIQNRGVKLITAMTPQDYQKLKSDNAALISQMAVVNVGEPQPEEVMDILQDTALTFEQRDNLLITYPALKEAYSLSGRYEQELAYPGKAINFLEQSIPYAADKIITPESVQQAVEKMRGVKVSKAESAEADTLLRLEDLIHARMINQERAVSVVASALRRGRAGVSNPNRPVGSFLFLGPTGVGKTELARSLAATYFGDESRMIRLDMSEYQRPDDVARLLDPGTEKSASLIMSVRQQPFSVILLDEIEKSHPNTLNLLLQMLDEGRLTDQNGRAASFKNAIIIATSNAGSLQITQKVAAGESLEKMEKPLVEELIAQGLYKPELINRFDEVVLFRPLNEKELLQVARIMLNGVNKTLSAQNLSVKLTDAALAQVVKAGYDPQFGARPMRRAIQKKVEDAVAKQVLSGRVQPGAVITLDVKDLS